MNLLLPILSLSLLSFMLALFYPSFYPSLLGAGFEVDTASSGLAIEKMLRAMMSDSSTEAQSLHSLAKSNKETC